MRFDVAVCEANSHYQRRIDCAVNGSKKPADYIDQTTLGETCDVFNPPAGVSTSSIGDSTTPCTLCNRCLVRANSWSFYGVLDTDLGELSGECPSLLPQDVTASDICQDGESEGSTWVCPESLNINGEMEIWDPIFFEWDPEFVAWEAIGKPVCIAAPDSVVALTNCKSHCNNRDSYYHDMETNSNGNRRWDTINNFDCSLHNFNPPYQTNNPVQDCAGGGAMPSGMAPFKFTGSISIASMTGASALVTPIEGVADYAISDCAGGHCSLTVTSIEVFSHSTSGSYMDAAGGGGTYAYSEVSMRLAEPMNADLNQSRGAVTFTDDANMILDVDNITIDGLPVGSIDNRYASTSQAVGSLSNGTLTLNVILQDPTLTAYVTLNVTP